MTKRSEEDQIVVNQVGARIFQMIPHYNRFVTWNDTLPRDLARCGRSSVEMRCAESEE
jgi:hypothetical protein